MRPSIVCSHPWVVAVASLALAGAAVLPFAAGPTFAAEGLAAYEPQQAVVFDGATTAASTYFIAFSQAGFLLDLGSGGLVTCAGTNHVSPGGVAIPALANSKFQMEWMLAHGFARARSHG